VQFCANTNLTCQSAPPLRQTVVHSPAPHPCKRSASTADDPAVTRVALLTDTCQWSLFLRERGPCLSTERSSTATPWRSARFCPTEWLSPHRRRAQWRGQQRVHQTKLELAARTTELRYHRQRATICARGARLCTSPHVSGPAQRTRTDTATLCSSHLAGLCAKWQPSTQRTDSTTAAGVKITNTSWSARLETAPSRQVTRHAPSPRRLCFHLSLHLRLFRQVWDLSAPRHANPLRSLEEHRHEVYCVTWNCVRRDVFLSASWDDTVKLWCALTCTNAASQR